MRNVIIGTAGHVDHGKTSLIRALTGIDTDRLKEEKERGITIEAGFAYLALPNGNKCGIIDVPGHERFIKNMLSGSGSVDVVLLAIAADEGIMPQTKEHLQILTLLNIHSGVIALTKCDTVDDDWLDMVHEDIKKEFKGTFLQNAPIIDVSAKTGQGIEALKGRLTEMVMQLESQECEKSVAFRLPVDRVFSVAGFGTVVTGTLIEGEISINDEVELYPQKIKSKIRNIQVHSADTQTAHKGQRVALNLNNIKINQIQKGCVLASPNSMDSANILNVRLQICADCSKRIESGSRLHLHYATAETLCRVVLLDRDFLLAGQSCYAQLFTQDEVSTKIDDRFVVRFYSPTQTIGGGVIISPCAEKLKRNTDSAKTLERADKGGLKEKIKYFLSQESAQFLPTKQIRINPFAAFEDFDEVVGQMSQAKELYAIKDALMGADYYLSVVEKCTKLLEKFHKENPLCLGINKGELTSRLFRDPNTYTDEVIDLMIKDGHIKQSGVFIGLSGFESLVSPAQQKISTAITQALLEGGFCTPTIDELAAKFPKDTKTFKQVLDWLVAEEKIVLLSNQIAISAEFFKKAVECAQSHNGEFSLAEFRDKIQGSRKYALALLEYMDLKKITVKNGDLRVYKR